MQSLSLSNSDISWVVAQEQAALLSLSLHCLYWPVVLDILNLSKYRGFDGSALYILLEVGTARPKAEGGL